MKIILIVLGVLLLLGVGGYLIVSNPSFQKGFHESYDSGFQASFKTSFIASCNKGSETNTVHTAACSCMADYLVANYSVNDLTYFGIAVKPSTQTPDNVKNAVNAAGDYCTKK